MRNSFEVILSLSFKSLQLFCHAAKWLAEKAGNVYWCIWHYVWGETIEMTAFYHLFNIARWAKTQHEQTGGMSNSTWKWVLFRYLNPFSQAFPESGCSSEQVRLWIPVAAWCPPPHLASQPPKEFQWQQWGREEEQKDAGETERTEPIIKGSSENKTRKGKGNVLLWCWQVLSLLPLPHKFAFGVCFATRFGHAGCWSWFSYVLIIVRKIFAQSREIVMFITTG